MRFDRLAGWLSGPRPERRIALLALLCALPSLAMGLHTDDYFLRRNLSERGPFAAYWFVARDPQVAHAQLLAERADGRAPWWTEEHPRGAFFRPLTSLTLWLDLARDAPAWWMHLQNAALYALLVALVVALYRRRGLTGPGLAWAAFFFALDAPLAQSVGWIAGRDTLLCACFGFACLLAHDRARSSRDPRLLALASLCFALALLSGEFGLCTLGYLAAHALTVDRGTARARAFALSPYALVTVLHLAYWMTGGYGFHDGGIYRDVLRSPVVALSAWLESVPVYLATTATVPLANFQLLVPGFRLPLLVFSLVALGAVALWLGRRVMRESEGRMFALGAALSVVPLVATLPQERLRFFVAYGVFGVLGPAVARDFDAPGRARRWMTRAVWAMHAIVLPLAFVPSLFSMAAANAPVVAFDRALPRATSPTAILLNPPVFSVPWIVRARREHAGDLAPPTYILYSGSQPLDVTRIDARTLEVHIARSWGATPFEQHLRNFARHPLRAGDRFDLNALDVEVREVNDVGAPTRVRFTFDRSADDPALAFHAWRGPTIVRWTPPPIGARVEVAAAPAF